jgi:hypothetical protein
VRRRAEDLDHVARGGGGSQTVEAEGRARVSQGGKLVQRGGGGGDGEGGERRGYSSSVAKLAVASEPGLYYEGGDDETPPLPPASSLVNPWPSFRVQVGGMGRPLILDILGI